MIRSTRHLKGLCMPHLTRLRAASAALAAGALTLGGLALASPAQASTPRIAIAGTHPTCAAVSTPGNALYRHFLTPAQAQARFGATAAQVAAVESWLRQSGLTVTSVSNHLAGGYVAVRGSVAAARRAFGVTFARYHVAGQGTVRAPVQAATAPSGVAASVLTVSGLSTARQAARPMTASASQLPPPGPNYWVAKPCASWYGQKVATSKPKAYGAHQPYAVCGYTPRQVRGAYGVTSSGATGNGQTVAIVDAY